MGTSLIASLDTHRSISRYVASLLPQKSHSSRREQNASLIVRSSSFSCLRKKRWLSLICSVSYVLGPAALQWSWESPSPPINADLCLLTQTSMASLGAGIPVPLARYHTIVICKGNHIKPPTTRSPTQRFPSVKNLINIPNYSFNKNSHILENGLVPPH